MVFNCLTFFPQIQIRLHLILSIKNNNNNDNKIKKTFLLDLLRIYISFTYSIVGSEILAYTSECPAPIASISTGID